MSLAGMLEIADHEFQGIQDEDKRFTEEARSRVEEGSLGLVEITPDALKAFLDKRLGPDGRISEYSYDWTARLLKKLGYRTLDQVEKCILGYDDDSLSRIASGSRLGQTTRFEHMLLAGMGENYIRRHPSSSSPWFDKREHEQIELFKNKGVDVREYDPTTDVPAPGSEADGSGPSARPSVPAPGLEEAASNPALQSISEKPPNA